MKNKKITLLNEDIMNEIDEKLTDILDEMSSKHGAIIEEMFICLTGFAVELQETIEHFNNDVDIEYKPLKELRSDKLEVTLTDEQKAINAKMN